MNTQLSLPQKPEEVCENIAIRWLGKQDYCKTWQAMQQFTERRTASTLDEIWLLEHDPVFTQGQNGKMEHVLHPGNIPVVQTDRGGQITYHGPGQLMIYTLLDIKRKKLFIRKLVSLLEQTVIDFLASYNISAYARPEAPGVYIAPDKKIASIGLRIKRGCSYHGIAFNIHTDLEPFTRINPCGFKNLAMTNLAQESKNTAAVKEIAEQFLPILAKNLDYRQMLCCD